MKDYRIDYPKAIIEQNTIKFAFPISDSFRPSFKQRAYKNKVTKILKTSP